MRLRSRESTRKDQTSFLASGKWVRRNVAPASVLRNGANLAQFLVTNPVTAATVPFDGGGHTMYPFFPPPNADGTIPSSGDTCYQIAARYLNAVGAQIYDQMNPTVPAPTTPAGYQWFSSLASG